MPVKVSINKNWSSAIERGMKSALLELGNDILTRAVVLAPVETGALRNSGKVTMQGDTVKVSFGSSAVPYARRRHFENRKNPQTLGYLAKAGDSVARGDKSKYFRNKVQW